LKSQTPRKPTAMPPGQGEDEEPGTEHDERRARTSSSPTPSTKPKPMPSKTTRVARSSCTLRTSPRSRRSAGQPRCHQVRPRCVLRSGHSHRVPLGQGALPRLELAGRVAGGDPCAAVLAALR
jgi:hypothetical protein